MHILLVETFGLLTTYPIKHIRPLGSLIQFHFGRIRNRTSSLRTQTNLLHRTSSQQEQIFPVLIHLQRRPTAVQLMHHLGTP